MNNLQIEAFDKAKHERAGFRCGQPSLDRFLNTLVTQYEKRRLGKTFVAVRSGDSKVLGYYTLASSAVAFGHLPESLSRKLPKHPVPVILLARLAVSEACQGQGIGEALLMLVNWDKPVPPRPASRYIKCVADRDNLAAQLPFTRLSKRQTRACI